MDLRRVLPPTEAMAAQALAAARVLVPLAKRRSRQKTVTIRPENGEGKAVTVPLEAFELFIQILEQMAAGKGVTLVPYHAELTTQQAADMLNVSRPYLIGLLKEGKIHHHTVGTHRRIKMADLHAYQKAEDERQLKALDELTAETQRLGINY